MMSYQYMTAFNARCFTKSKAKRKILYIVLHHWGARGQSFMGVVNWFCQNPSCQTSAHYVVAKGKVACLVDLCDIAWHAGNWYFNEHSIGIECRPEASEGDYRTTAELIANIWRYYGKLPIIEHREIPFVRTACPGVWDKAKLHLLAEKYYKNK